MTITNHLESRDVSEHLVNEMFESKLNTGAWLTTSLAQYYENLGYIRSSLEQKRS